MRAPARIAGVAVAAVLALSIDAAVARASTLDLFGFGARSPAMAGTGVAAGVGYENVFLNPGGLALGAIKRLTLGVTFGDFFLDIDHQTRDTDATQGAFLGGVLPIPMQGVMKDRVTLGIGFYFPFEAINRARVPAPGTPNFALLDSRSQVVALQLALAIAASERVGIGVGLIALAELQGGIDVQTDAAGRFTTISEQELITHLAPIVGARWDISERVAAGMTLRGESRSDYEIIVTSDLGDALPLEVPTLRIAGTSQYDPLNVVGEVAFRPTERVLLTGQLGWYNWSAYPPPTHEPVEGQAPQEPIDFHDIVIPRVGAEIALLTAATHLDLRAGYALALSPAPEMDGQQSLLDNHRHIAAFGLGLSLPHSSVPLYIDAWVQMQLLVPRTHTKDPSRFEPDEVMPFDSIDTDGYIVIGGLAVGVDI